MTLKKWSLVNQLCPTLCNPMDCSLPGSSIHGIFQTRVLEWVDISFSRRSSQPRDRTQVSRIAGRCFTLWATREAHYFLSHVTIWLRNCLLLLHSIRKTFKTTLFFFFQLAHEVPTYWAFPPFQFASNRMTIEWSMWSSSTTFHVVLRE